MTKAEQLAQLEEMEMDLAEIDYEMKGDEYFSKLIGIANQRDMTYREMAERDFADLFFVPVMTHEQKDFWEG